MYMTDLNQVLPQEDIHIHFVLEGSRLYRKLASGAATQLKSLDGNQVVTAFNSHRLRGVDIAWCLIYGNWPHFPIVQLRGDAHNFDRHNLYPARTKRLRYTETRRGRLFVHPLSSIGHVSSSMCRGHWEDLAHDYYVKDMPYVLQVEEQLRAVRAQTVDPRGSAAGAGTLAERPVKLSRPPAVAGREWHWVKAEWISVPVACHVADDYRVRVQKQALGAVRFEYDPAVRMVRGYDTAGMEVRLA